LDHKDYLKTMDLMLGSRLEHLWDRRDSLWKDYEGELPVFPDTPSELSFAQVSVMEGQPEFRSRGTEAVKILCVVEMLGVLLNDTLGFTIEDLKAITRSGLYLSICNWRARGFEEIGWEKSFVHYAKNRPMTNKKFRSLSEPLQ
jgi:hypothetical protein